MPNSMNSIVLFDMDGTLTPPRSKMESFVLNPLRDLQKFADIGIVTGSDYDYIMQQCEAVFDIGGLKLDNLYLFPCNGTKRYVWKNCSYRKTYDVEMIEKIGKEDYRYIMQSLFALQLSMSITFELPCTGTFFDYRGSMLNWCPIGRLAESEDREAWIKLDLKHKIREKYLKEIRDAIDKKNIKVDVTLGGSTSFDLYPAGWDKTYVTEHLQDYENIIFVGDACDPSGNDYTLYTLLKDGENTQSFRVDSPQDTVNLIPRIIEKLRRK
jgi:phosphomannomutase